MILIKNGTIVNEGLSCKGSLSIQGERIGRILREPDFESPRAYLDALRQEEKSAREIIDAEGCLIIPGVIDDQVHFREPGNTTKATIASESKAAVLGGVTAFMDMPNNTPPAATLEALERKYETASRDSAANYSFYLGATDENIDEIRRIDRRKVCGVKVFMGSSTGNMLVNDPGALQRIFQESPVLIATHCEEEEIIKANLKQYTERYGDGIPFEAHPDIRSREACIRCTERAVRLAEENGSRLHILHLSTAEELEIIRKARQNHPAITGEICVHYLLLSREDYPRMGAKMKCNPAIKESSDRDALRNAVKEGLIRVVATDHAPHLKEEKENPYPKAPSGLPLIQHSLQIMLELAGAGVFTREEVIDRMCHGPADCFRIRERGYLRENYFADIVVVDPDLPDSDSTRHPAYKCGWSPFEGKTFRNSIRHTFVNGTQVVQDGKLTGKRCAKRLSFDR